MMNWQRGRDGCADDECASCFLALMLSAEGRLEKKEWEKRQKTLADELQAFAVQAMTMLASCVCS